MFSVSPFISQRRRGFTWASRQSTSTFQIVLAGGSLRYLLGRQASSTSWLAVLAESCFIHHFHSSRATSSIKAYVALSSKQAKLCACKRRFTSIKRREDFESCILRMPPPRAEKHTQGLQYFPLLPFHTERHVALLPGSAHIAAAAQPSNLIFVCGDA